MLYIAACYSIASSSKVDAKQAVLCFYGTTFYHQDLFNKNNSGNGSVSLAVYNSIDLFVGVKFNFDKKGKSRTGVKCVVSVNNVWDDTTQLDMDIIWI